MEQNKKSVFETLSAINVSGKTEKKNGLTYLSWAYAWGELCKVYPTATYKVHERDTQWGPCNYFTDGRTAWVKVSVTIGDLTHTEMLPIMDYRNKSIPLDKVTSCDANKAIQRCITKAVARFGLGLYVYAGEDLPSSVEYSDPIQAQPVQQPVEKAVVQPQTTTQKPVQAQKQPVRDTRPATKEMLDFVRKAIADHSLTAEFICRSYKVAKLDDLCVYQAIHIKNNLSKLERMYLADIVEQSKQAQAEARTDLTFGEAIADAIAPPQQEEGGEIDLESLGLSTADLDALTECGAVFS